MKNRVIVPVLIFLALVGVLFVGGCKTDSGPGPDPNPFEGTYKSQAGNTVVMHKTFDFTFSGTIDMGGVPLPVENLEGSFTDKGGDNYEVTVAAYNATVNVTITLSPDKNTLTIASEETFGQLIAGAYTRQ
ncbi:MAG: hypothetical protein LBQ38_05945 [Spirochaetaceae bacterium]|jgi:hypothetical protein|nr:hypothetical protein [Spirochaetaceae bacterium]